MLLSSFHVRDFQSVRDSNRIDTRDITCLVGKNEAGKTALLRALYRLNPINEKDSAYDVTDDYPRADVTEYEQAIREGQRKHAVVVTAVFTLEPEELAPIEDEFGRGVLPTPAVTLTRSYENTRDFALEVAEKVAGTRLLAKFGVDEELKGEAFSWGSLSDLNEALSVRAQAQDVRFNDALTRANAIEDVDAKARAIAEAQPLQESAASKGLRAALSDVNRVGLSRYVFDRYISAQLPQFVYFDEYYQMRGAENIDALQQRDNAKALLPHDYPLLGLIDLAGLHLSEVLNPNRTQELKNKLQGASNHLTAKILKYWSQNRHLRLSFDVRPARPGDPVGMQNCTNIWAEVVDQKHFVNTALGTRSRGFVWFFSFLAWYSRLKTTAKQRVILLLDEPGLSLHAKAQGDLLRYFEEELKGRHQLIYTTHSPFMVDPRHFERVRIVQDRSIDTADELPEADAGTKVVTDILDATQDSLFPLQGALGYEIYQTLFIGPNTLVVEGASDLLYIQTLSALLAQQHRENLSPAWTITPTGGADRVPAFVSLIGAQDGMLVATLIDFEKQHTQMVENLYKKKLLNKKHVLTFAHFTKKSESDIEDMFEREFYLSLVNEEYKQHLTKPITVADLNQNIPRVLTAIEEYFLSNPLQGAVFSHYRPARYLTENVPALFGQLPAATLDRFEGAFKALNALLT
jgi:energy-coupling factor transporter ATP-binding protein EcfA2